MSKGGRCVRLTTYHTCSAERQEIRGPNLPGPPWAISTAGVGETFTFTLYIYIYIYIFMSLEQILHDHPYYGVCPNILSLVRDPLSGNGCGSPNHI